MKKRASSHLEMVMAFLFFIGFTTFIFAFVKPYPPTSLTGAVVSGLENSLKKKAETNLSQIFIKIDPLPPGCNEINLDRKTFYTLSNSLVKKIKQNGKFEKIKSGIDSPPNLQIKDDSPGGQEEHLIAFISPEFKQNNLQNCFSLDPAYITFGSIYEKEILSNKSLHDMKKKYYSDYKNLKKELKIPESNDFSITSPDFPEINMERKIPESVEVYSKEIVVEILNSKGEIINPRMIIKVW